VIRSNQKVFWPNFNHRNWQEKEERIERTTVIPRFKVASVKKPEIISTTFKLDLENLFTTVFASRCRLMGSLKAGNFDYNK